MTRGIYAINLMNGAGRSRAIRYLLLAPPLPGLTTTDHHVPLLTTTYYDLLLRTAAYCILTSV